MAAAKKVALVGASENDATLIQQLIEQNRNELDPPWQISPEGSADFLLVDIDSIYGHMDWLKIRSSGRAAAVFTDAPHSKESDIVLRKPLRAANLLSVLNDAAAMLTGGEAKPVAARSESVAAPAPAPAPMAAREPAEPSAPAAAAPVAPVAVAAATVVVEPAAAVVASPERQDEPVPMVAAEAPISEPVAPRELRLGDFLDATVLKDPVRLSAEGLPTVILDPAAQTYHAPAGLKVLGGWCTRTLQLTDFQPIDNVELSAAQTAFPAQPWSRLRWLAGLLGSSGQFAADLDPTARYKLARWPQSEREFPRHFRIATAMMKTAATADEIAEQAGTPVADVIDFINGYHATGFIHTEGGELEENAQREQGRGNNLLSRWRKPFGN